MPKTELRRLSQNLLHSVTVRQVNELENVFAQLTPKGWVVPDWLKLLRKSARYRR